MNFQEGATNAAVADPFSTSPSFIRKLTLTNIMTLKPAEMSVFVAEKNDLITEVWRGLNRHRFSSCPVLQKRGHRFYAFIDLNDIMQYFLDCFGDATLKNSLDFLKLAESDENFRKLTVDDLLKHPDSIVGRLTIYPVHHTFSLYFGFELVARDIGIQRIPIVDSDYQLKNLITQSQIVEYIRTKTLEVGSKRFKKIGQFLSDWRYFVCINEMEPTIEAFKRMSKAKLSTSAVVNEVTGEIRDVISLKDLQIIANDAKLFSKLFMCAISFVNILKNDTVRPKDLVTISMDDTLETATNLLCENRIHNVFVVNAKKIPIGLITLKHILFEILID